MSDALRDRLRAAYSAGASASLAGAELAQVLAALGAAARQELLYIQAATTHPGASALGMLFVRGDGCEEPPEDPARWPYQNVWTFAFS